MLGPVMRAMMEHSSGHEEPRDEIATPLAIHPAVESPSEVIEGDVPLGVDDVVWDSLDGDFTLPPPAVGVYEDNPMFMEDLRDLDGVDIESTALDTLDQSSQMSTIDDLTIATSVLRSTASSVASFNIHTDDLGRSTTRSMLSTPALGLRPALAGPVPEDGSWADLRVSLVIWGLKVRREQRTLDYLLQHWVALMRRVCVGDENSVVATCSNHRQHMQAPVECAHRVGGRRVAFRSSRRALAGPRERRRISPAARRSSQQACAVRQVAQINRVVNREALEQHYRRVLRGNSRF
jgi:hypothetical protein